MVMEFKKKRQEISVGIRRETSLDDQDRHQGNFFSPGWSRLISGCDLASMGGKQASETKTNGTRLQSDRTKTHSPSSKSEGSRWQPFLVYWPCWDYLPIWLQSYS